ncbi:MAG: hypothetical protein JKX69_03600 [Rhodobacteraceae bacterium]|nr:hypothetical protein [Paracoccaceae bacterium]
MIEDIDGYFTKGCGRSDRFATPYCSALVWAEGLGGHRQVNGVSLIFSKLANSPNRVFPRDIVPDCKSI